MFIADANKYGHEVDYHYSGKGMYGKECPAVYLDRTDRSFRTNANTVEDNMGLGTVVYARN